MKKFILIAWLFVACTYVERPTPVTTVNNGYDVFTGDGGVQMTRATYNGVEMYMEYAMFMSLMNNGGWGSVYSTYQRNPSRYYNTTIVNHYNNVKPTKSYGSDNKVRSSSVWGSKSNNNPVTKNTWGSKTSSNSWGSKTTSPSVKTTPSKSSSWGSKTSSNKSTSSWGSSKSSSSSWGSSKKRN